MMWLKILASIVKMNQNQSLLKSPAHTPDSEPAEEPQSGDVIADTFDPEIERWKRWWMIPLWVGVGITVIGGLLMVWAYQASGFSFWFG